jgi:hypothetical protein
VVFDGEVSRVGDYTQRRARAHDRRDLHRPGGGCPKRGDGSVVSRLLSALGILVILFLSMGFASLNSGQRVTLRLGLATFYGVPLTVVAFGSLIAGW